MLRKRRTEAQRRSEHSLSVSVRSSTLSDSIPRQRLYSQLLAHNALDTPHNVVSHFGAVQAQDYLGALWAIGLRTCSPSEADVERAVAERRIVRCWPMRGTLHFVAAE